ncbi:MAG: hypothetical protein JNK02_16410 [Planctomycetes bacterium]|nr:hypothetical protein [Planctomycetota bacterium]
MRSAPSTFAFTALTLAALARFTAAQCPELGPVQNYTGAGTITCPCFVPGEEALAVFSQVPAADFPIRITKIAIGWGSQNGGALPAVEDALVVYNGIPSGGASPAYMYFAPQLTDGFINEFDISTTAPQAVINSGPFTVGLRFFNQVNVPSGGVYPPSTIEDNGCQSGKNRVKVLSGLPPGFYDGCFLGLSGDWVIHVKYERVSCGGGGVIGTSFCLGDGSGAVLCPCDPGQSGNPGEGCANSTGRGARLGASGIASVSNDQAVLRVEGVPSVASCLFFQGNAQQNGGNGAPFGDGLLCVTSNVIRLGTKNAAGGVAEYGYQIGADIPISIRGNVPALGATRHYQVWYRNAAVFCTASTFNLSNGHTLQWVP